MQIRQIDTIPVGSFVYVKIHTKDGLYGIGEASLSGRQAAVVGALEHITPLLIGCDATRIEHIWQDIFRGTFWRGGPVLQSALAGIDIALWDLNGKALGVPVHRMLGGLARDKVLVYRHVGGTTPAQLVERSQALLEEGWKVLRISPIVAGEGKDHRPEVGFDPTRAILNGIDHMAALREAVGPEVEIIFEVHTRLTPTRAIELCRQLEPHRPFFVEDPIRSESPGAFRTLRQHTSVAIGTGEQLHDKWAYRQLIEEELIDYLRVDICHTGGITEGKKLAHLAEMHYQELATHYTSSPVSSAAMLHLNLSIANCAVQEFAPPSGWMNDVVRHDLRTEDGYLLASDEPGLGIDIDEDAARKVGVSDHEPPHLRRPDGAVQDW
ncbi:MAG: enolase C-terminal domain-like protein [Candidatus Latescibacterota bacterium]